MQDIPAVQAWQPMTELAMTSLTWHEEQADLPC